MSPERMERMFGTAPPAKPLERHTFPCSNCKRHNIILEQRPANRWRLRLSRAGIVAEHLGGAIFRVTCPFCAWIDLVTLPLPAREFMRLKDEADASSDASSKDDRQWHPFGCDDATN